MNNIKVAKAVVKVLQLRLDTEIQLCSFLGTVQAIYLSFPSFNLLICKIRVSIRVKGFTKIIPEKHFKGLPGTYYYMLFSQ